MKVEVLSDYEKARRDAYAPLVERFIKERQDDKIFIFGLSCGTGWKEIVFKLVDELDRIWTGHQKQNGRDCWKLRQVKEKFGGLRFYAVFPEEEGDAKNRREQCYAAIDFAETQAWKTCERCGKPGQVISFHYRMATVCDECHDRWKKRAARNEDDVLFG